MRKIPFTRSKATFVALCLLTTTAGATAFVKRDQITQAIVVGNSASTKPFKLFNVLEPSKKNAAAATNNSVEPTAKINQLADSNQTEQPVPTQITYLFLFQRIAILAEKAREAEEKGEDAASLSGLYQRLANLTNEQSASLTRIAMDCMTEVKVKDEQAKQVAAQLRAQQPQQYSADSAPTPPPPPAELTELQKERDAIVLRYRSYLENEFGSDFARFEAFVYSTITSNITKDVQKKAAFPPPNKVAFNGQTQLQTEPQPTTAKEQNKQ